LLLRWQRCRVLLLWHRWLHIVLLRRRRPLLLLCRLFLLNAVVTHRRLCLCRLPLALALASLPLASLLAWLLPCRGCNHRSGQRILLSRLGPHARYELLQALPAAACRRGRVRQTTVAGQASGAGLTLQAGELQASAREPVPCCPVATGLSRLPHSQPCAPLVGRQALPRQQPPCVELAKDSARVGGPRESLADALAARTPQQRA
jgi:hypothetical protein